MAHAKLARQTAELVVADQLREDSDVGPLISESAAQQVVARVEEAVAAGDKKAAITALKAAEPEIMRSVQKGVLHKNTVARKMSRLAARVKALATA